MNKNAILGLTAAALFLLSVFSYQGTQTRAERFERGQKFLSQLNPDNIKQIDIKKGDEEVVLKRNEDQFVVAGHHGYPAKNESVNRFIKDILEIALEKEAGSGESDAAELHTKPGTEENIEITLKSGPETVMVHFSVGKATEDGRGRYLQRFDGNDQNIYLSSKGIFLSTGNDQFLNKEILDIAAEEIASVSAPDFSITTQENQLALNDVPAGKEVNTSELNNVTSALKGLSFEKVYLADDPQVQGLAFTNSVTFNLKDESDYRVTTAVKDNKTYLKISANHKSQRIGVSMEDSEEQLEEKASLLERMNEVQAFNQRHGSWVYELGDFTAKKFTQTKAGLLKDPEKKEKS
ncbi:DUF4340 domain-containing protein [Acanthopleuribacter pedis]|uniref:DUF4340 domain-containing protein n=1 Tax=Acanthopleuribacter pedis TaxID=442870 RepID=A0A8J7Q0G9_9BACT|nr:DUF4340 domain-containing protein [Acanthopleuribacter pedis]MBO1317004.1 DUF4340 domain-containing protein [Acanthopleuribacter pedis]